MENIEFHLGNMFSMYNKRDDVVSDYVKHICPEYSCECSEDIFNIFMNVIVI